MNLDKKPRRGRTPPRRPNFIPKTASANWDVPPDEGEIIDRSRKKKRWKKRRKGRKKEILSEDVDKISDAEVRSTEEGGTEDEEEPDFPCLSARTALIIPYSYNVSNSAHLADQLKQRFFLVSTSDGNSEKIPLWESNVKMPNEVMALSPQFRQFIGVKGKRYSPEKTWTCHRLIMNQKILQEVFSEPKIHSLIDGDEFEYSAAFEKIEMVLYPRGSALLVIHINWMPRNSRLTICDMRTLIFISKHMRIIKNVCLGWSFCSSEPLTLVKPEEQLGYDLYSARTQEMTISLYDICSWLFHIPDMYTETSTSLEQQRNAMHQSVVVIDREPDHDTLYGYLFHMRRGFGQANRPPINSESTLGRVLVWRLNRYLGLSREGNVSISWPIDEASREFEVGMWHRKFLGIYLLLALHAHGERLVFNVLSDLAALQAENLTFVTEEVNLTQVKNSRDSLRTLATQLARYTLGMSSGDCGGTTEYSDFFVTLRQIYGIGDLRSELSGELKDVLAVVESGYLEEERRQRDIEENERRRKFEIHQQFQQEKEAHDRNFEAMVSIIGAFTLPFVIVAGIWGMNLTDLPDVSFWLLMLITGIFSIVLLVALVWGLRQKHSLFEPKRVDDMDFNDYYYQE